MFLQKCNFSQAQYKLPEDGPGGPKHVGANIAILMYILVFCMFNKECICW